MPRRSSAALAVAPLAGSTPAALPAPAGLTRPEAKIWRDTIGRAPWLTADMAPLCLAYVRSAAAVDRLWAEMQAEPHALVDLARAYRAEVKLLAMLARSLRLTAQARQDRSTARAHDDAPRVDFRRYLEGASDD